MEEEKEPTYDELKRWYKQDIVNEKIMNFFWSTIVFSIVLLMYSGLVIFATFGACQVWLSPEMTDLTKTWLKVFFNLSRDLVFVYICWHYVFATLYNFKEEIVSFVKKAIVFIQAGKKATKTETMELIP